MDYSKFNAKNDSFDSAKIFKLHNIDFMLFGWFTGFLRCLEKSNSISLFDNPDSDKFDISTSMIIDEFMKKFRIDETIITKRTLRNKLNAMIKEIDSDFFGCNS